MLTLYGRFIKELHVLTYMKQSFVVQCQITYKDPLFCEHLKVFQQWNIQNLREVYRLVLRDRSLPVILKLPLARRGSQITGTRYEKKLGHQQRGESWTAERGSSHRQQLLHRGQTEAWTSAEGGKKSQPPENPAIPSEEATKIKHHHSGGSSAHAKSWKEDGGYRTSTLHFFMWKSLDF